MKRKKITRILSLILVLSLLFCACGKKKEEAKEKISEEAAITRDENHKNTEKDPPVEDVDTIVLTPFDQIPAGTALTKEEVRLFGEDKCFCVYEISDELFSRIYGLSFKKNCTVPREDLRYVKVLHKDAEGTILVGELIVHKDVAEAIRDIFHELYLADYPIHKMHLVDDYGADDNASMEADNTSAFNYRLIAGTSELSNHAFGKAIDINPYYNPYCIPGQDYVSPASAYEYGDRSRSFDYKIEKGDLCYNLFIEHGFTWGGDWTGGIYDYQHFEYLK